MHACFWFYIFAWRELIGGLFSDKRNYNLAYFLDPLAISHYLLFPATFYFNYFYILPRFYKTRQIGNAWISWILLLLSFIFLRYLIQEVLFFHWLNIRNYTEGTSISYYIFDNIYYGGILIIMSTLFWILNDSISTQNEKMILLEEKKVAQLSFLKNQVNPHFIFNTLNNIYSLVSSGSDKALPSIEKLSQLMRYMYKDSEADFVSLQNEKNYLNSFIELQRIRLSNQHSVQYIFEGSITDQKIAPLILIPFIENMFKHGIINQVNKPLQIKIIVNDKTLQMHASNYINTLHKDEASGIGLQNVQKRLSLLYPNNHTLTITNNGEIYICSLQINL
jgi:two-component system, LytTR family, sensor kinase